ncbi:MAG: FlgD immunoglobulin-like domain containing protein [Bacteroidota bacterium]
MYPLHTPKYLWHLFLFLMFFNLPNLVFSQETEVELPPVSNYYKEVREGTYIPVDRESMPTSPAFNGSTSEFIFRQVNINANGENIVGDAANEPSIAIDPTNPDRIVIGWRQFDNINDSFRQAGFAYSTDGGESWTFPGSIDPGVFRSDPVLSADAEGNFHYNSLRVEDNEFFCTQFKSTGDGTWDEGTFAQGGDKQWMTIDNSGGEGDGHIYSYWTDNFSFCFPNQFTRSTDDNLSFEDCTSIPEDPFWGTLVVDADGVLYAAGANPSSFGLMVVRSDNAQKAEETPEWNQVVSADLGGFSLAFAGIDSPNPSGLMGQYWVDVDRSGGLNHGNVYVLSSLRPNDNLDPCDVFFARSTDGGLTWSNPVKVNDDLSFGAWQWLASMSVAPNGRIDAVWLDTRDNPGSFDSKLFYSFSEDGGLSWSANEALLDLPFDPHVGWPQQQKMGDYFHMLSDEEGAHLAWAATYNGEQDVYYGRIRLGSVSVQEQIQNKGGLFQNYPNPFYEQTAISYAILEAGKVNLSIYNELGQVVKTVVEEHQPTGDYTVQWNGQSQSGQPVKAGVYFYELKVNGFTIASKRLMYIR